MADPATPAPRASVSPLGNVGPLEDVTCDVSVVLGTGRMSVRQCLYLKPKTVIPLTQTAGADLQLTVNGVPIATGEVVVVDDSTAVRLTHILPPPSTERAA
jgi:flagellar motor switch protein FliN/FliY